MSDAPGAASGRRVVVVVLSYFGLADTLTCVESLVSGSPEATVLVVDNGSFDGTLEAVQERWGHVRTLQTGGNLGFAGGMNAGLAWALHDGADVVAVANNDIVCPPGALAALVADLPPDGAVSPEVRYAGQPDKVWFGGGVVEWAQNWPRHLNPAELRRTPDGQVPPASPLRSSEILAGCFLIASADVWRRAGLFDERYFLIFEDSDWSLRARSRGVGLYVDPTAVIYHQVSASFTGAYGYLAAFYYLRNGLLFGRSWGTRRLAPLRFLRHRIVPSLVAPLRERQFRESLRQLATAGCALACFVTGRYGRAPRALEAAAARWAGTSAA